MVVQTSLQHPVEEDIKVFQQSYYAGNESKTLSNSYQIIA